MVGLAMNEREYVSRKFVWLSFFAMVSVIMIHSISVLTTKSPAAWNVFAQHLLLRSFTYWAVPFFFMCSGFWFAKGKYVMRSVGEGPTVTVLAFWGKKVRTLLVPYVLWVLIAVVMILPLTLGNNYLMHRWLWERTFVDNAGVWGKVDGLFGIVCAQPSANGPLWYLRALILLFALAPIWRFVALRRWGWLALLAFGWVEIFVCPIGIPQVHLGGSSVGWFVLGMAVALKGWENVRLPKCAVSLAACVWIAAALAKCFHMVGVDFIPCEWFWRINALIPLGGVVCLWGLYDHCRVSSIEPRPWMRATFWVFCFHQIPISYFMAICLYVFGKGDGMTLLIALANVAFVAYLSFAIAGCAKRRFGACYHLLTGGR